MIGRFIVIIHFIVLIFYAHPACCQSIACKHYSVNDGLSHPNTYRVYQEPETGLLWIGTDYGLNRFDGKTFVNYVFSTPEISRNNILSIMRYAKDTLLLCYYREGIFLFDTRFGKIRKFPLSGISQQQHSFNHYIIKTMLIDGRIWFLSANHEVFYLDNNTLVIPPVLKNVKCLALTKQNDSSGIISCSKGIYKVSRKAITPLSTGSQSFYNCKALAFDNMNTLWLGQGKTLYKIENDKAIPVLQSPDGANIEMTGSDNTSRIWFVTSIYNLYCYSQGTITKILSNTTTHTTPINGFYFDSEENIWVTTHGDGLYKMSFSDDILFVKYENKTDAFNYVKGIGTIGDTTYASSMEGVFRIVKDNIEPMLKIPHPSGTDFAYCSFKDSAGSLYLGRRTGFYTINRKHHISRDPSVTLATLSTCTLANKTPAIGTFQGIFSISVQGKLQKIDVLVKNDRINCLLQDEQGYLWVGTDSGAYRYKDNKTESFFIKNGLINDKINAIYQDKKKRIWFATAGGLSCHAGKQWKSYSAEDGLTHNICNAITSDDRGYIWIGTLKGICYINLNGKLCRHPRSNLFINEEVLSLTAKTHYLWVGTIKNIIRLDLNHLDYNTSQIKLVINSVRLMDSTINPALPFEIPYRNRLTVNFAAVSFTTTDHQYEYRLSGYDNKWQRTNSSFIEFNSLPPGAYKLDIRTPNIAHDGYIMASQIQFSVLSPFWLKWWFILIAIVFLLAVTSIFFLIRINNIRIAQRKELAYQAQMVQLKHKALNATMNPHFLYNALNSIQHYINRHSKVMVSEYIAKFSRLIRINLSNADHTYIQLSEELNRLSLYLELEQLRFDEKFVFHINIDPQIDTEDISIPNMIIQPYVENAIWHGIMPKPDQGIINISLIQVDEGLLNIIIEDNGVGLSYHENKRKNRFHSSLGMKLTEERLLLCGESRKVKVEELLNDHNEVSGTRISILLDINYSTQ